MTRTETLVINKSQVGSLRKGDVITHIDGREMGPFRVSGKASVERIPIDSTRRVVETFIYPDTNISTEITVERTHRIATRTVSGVTFINAGDREWETADGRYRVYWDESGITECERDHPVKLTAEAVKSARENWNTSWARPILSAVSEGMRGYVCTAGTEHSYYAWMVWDTVKNDYAFDIRDAQTFKEAAGDLARSLS